MSRLRWLLFWRRQRDELAREMDAHIAERVDALVDDGLAEADARVQARREFGNRVLALEDGGAVHTWQWLDMAIASARDAFRSSRRNTGIWAMCVLVLGAATGLFTATVIIGDALLLRPVRLPGIDRVVTLGGLTEPEFGWTFNEWWSQAPSLGRVTRWNTGLAELETQEGRFMVRATIIEPDFPILFRSELLVGRRPATEDFADSRPLAISINEQLWVQRFGRKPAIVGTEVTLAGIPAIVVGVLSARSAFPHDTQAWIPRSDSANVSMIRALDAGANAQLTPGATLRDAHFDIEALAARLNSEHGPRAGKVYVGLFSLHRVADRVGLPYRVPVFALLGAVVTLVVMATASGAMVLFGLVLDRRHEFAVRASLGASRRRIAGQITAESAFAGMSAGVIGIATALTVLWIAQPTLAPLTPHLALADVWPSAALISVGASCALGMAVGVIPLLLSLAWRDWTLLSHVASDRGSSRGQRLRSTLAALQVAIAMTLLVTAAVAFRSTKAASATSFGFDPTRVVAARVMVPAGSSSSTLEQTLRSSLLGSGLTSAVSSAGRLPVFDRGGMLYIGPNSNVGAQVLPTRPGFFAAMGIPILQGRDLRDDDVDTVVVSETLARRMWPGQSPVGRQLSLGGPASRLVVGVAQDVRESFDPEEYGIGVGAARLYLPLAAPEKEMTARPQTLHLVMQCRDACDVLADTATSIVEAAGATVVDISPLQAGRDRLLAQTRFRSSSAATAASCCLVLAVVAVYGAVRRVTSTRLRELTIRMALGATPAQARWDILRHGVLLVTTGTVAGALAAWTLLSLVRPWLHGVAPSDPASFAVATLALAAGGVLATGGPAWRMGRLDPKQLLGE